MGSFWDIAAHLSCGLAFFKCPLVYSPDCWPQVIASKNVPSIALPDALYKYLAIIEFYFNLLHYFHYRGLNLGLQAC